MGWTDEEVLQGIDQWQFGKENGYKYLAEKLAQSGWISVKHRLPEYSKLVLIWGKLEQYNERKVYTGINIQSGADNRWRSLGNTLHDVTHWMPLPNPPQGDK